MRFGQRMFLAGSVPLFLIASNQATSQTKVSKAHRRCRLRFVPPVIWPSRLRRQLQGSRSGEARGPSATRPFACRFSDVGWLSPVRSSARRQLATQRYACVTPSWLRVGQRWGRMAPTERMAPRPRFAEARCHASFAAAWNGGADDDPSLPPEDWVQGCDVLHESNIPRDQISPDRRRRIRNFTLHYCV